MSSMKSQTFYILRGFDNKDWQDLKYYFESPFFFNPQTREPILPTFVNVLYEYFESRVEENPQNPSYEYVWSKLYGREEKIDTKRITNLLSKLEDHLNTFFAHRLVKDDSSLLNSTRVLKYLNGRTSQSEDTRKYFKRKLSKFERYFIKEKEQSSEYWYACYLLEVEKGVFFKTEDKFNRDTYLKKIVENLDFFYVLDKLKYLCILLDRSKTTDGDISDLSIEEFSDYLEVFKTAMSDVSPLFKMYYHLLMGLTKEDYTIHYQRLEKEFLKSGLEISSRERINIGEFIINYYVRRINKEETEYRGILYSFYLDSLKRDLITLNGRIGYGKYRNIIIIAIQEGKWEWAKEFAKDYQNKIHPIHRAKDSYSYAQAILSFSQEKPDYEQTVTYLGQIHSRFVFFVLWRRTLLIMCYYELGEPYSKTLEHELDSFKQYIYKKELKERTESYQNFVRLLRRVVKMTVFEDAQTNYQLLLREIKEIKKLVHRDWLLEKLKSKAK